MENTTSEEKETKGVKDKYKQIKLGIVLLIVCFAWSSWIDFHGLWVEVPILVHILPEGWSLPSYINAFVQVANALALIFTFINKKCPGNLKNREVIVAYIIMSVGLVAVIMLIFFWDETAHVAGAERSIALLTLVLFLSMVDTTSCIIYLPYMARFSELYMPAYMAGEDVGGLFTGLLGLIQGVGGEAICYNHTEWIYNETTGMNNSETSIKVAHNDPRFSVSVFFVFLAIIMLTSIISFSILNFSNYSKDEMIRPSRIKTNDFTLESSSGNFYTINSEDNITDTAADEKLSTFELSLCVFFFGWCSFIVYGLFLSIESYSTLPYGALTYTLAVQLTAVCRPLASFIAYFLCMKSLRGLSAVVGIVTVCIGYHIYLASQSPTPPLHDHVAGAIISATSMVLSHSLYAYVRACTSSLLNDKGGHGPLYYAGAAIQIGSFVGGILAFVLVSVLEVFESLPECE